MIILQIILFYSINHQFIKSIFCFYHDFPPHPLRIPHMCSESCERSWGIAWRVLWLLNSTGNFITLCVYCSSLNDSVWIHANATPFGLLLFSLLFLVATVLLTLLVDFVSLEKERRLFLLQVSVFTAMLFLVLGYIFAGLYSGSRASVESLAGYAAYCLGWPKPSDCYRWTRNDWIDTQSTALYNHIVARTSTPALGIAVSYTIWFFMNFGSLVFTLRKVMGWQSSGQAQYVARPITPYQPQWPQQGYPQAPGYGQYPPQGWGWYQPGYGQYQQPGVQGYPSYQYPAPPQGATPAPPAPP
jgi:hypothetical protein